MKAGRLFLIFLAGALFGTGLAISGMTDPGRVIGFLDVFGAWDPALLFVMAGAVGVYGLGMLLLRRFRINAIPTMALFKDGQEVTRQVGAMAAPAIRKFLEPFLKNGQS